MEGITTMVLQPFVRGIFRNRPFSLSNSRPRDRSKPRIPLVIEPLEAYCLPNLLLSLGPPGLDIPITATGLSMLALPPGRSDSNAYEEARHLTIASSSARGRGFDDLFAQQQEGREIKGEAPDSAVLPKPSFLVSRPSPLTQGVDAAPFDLAVLFHVNFGFPDLDAPPRHAGHAGTSDLAEGRRGDPPNIAPSNVSTQGGTSIVSASAGSSMPLSPGLMFFAGTGVGTRSSASATPLAAGSNHLLGL